MIYMVDDSDAFRAQDATTLEPRAYTEYSSLIGKDMLVEVWIDIPIASAILAHLAPQS